MSNADFFAPTINVAKRLMELYAIDPGPMFRAWGIDPGLARDNDARLPSNKVIGLMENVAARVEDPCFGLRVGEVMHPSYIGAMGFAWLASTSLRAGIGRLQRYLGFLSDLSEIGVADDGEYYSIDYSHQRSVPKDVYWVGDCRLAFFMWLCRMNAGPAFNPVAVEFLHQQPDHALVARYYALFRCPVEFDAGRNRLKLKLADVDRELDSANPHLAQVNDQIMIEAIARLDRSKTGDRVRAMIIRELPSGEISQDLVARKLHMATRTLQRRLSNEGATFKGLLNEIRQDLGKKYVRHSALSLKEISFLLGYSSPSAFTKAYRSWTGVSPSADRKK